MKQKDIDILEDIIDRTTIGDVIDALSTIAFEKSAHVEENWQDDDLSDAWIETGQELESCFDTIQTIWE